MDRKEVRNVKDSRSTIKSTKTTRNEIKQKQG